jgi:Flp pilus assembly pilin Flp
VWDVEVAVWFDEQQPATMGRRRPWCRRQAGFVRDDRGQDLIEYGLLIGIITVGAIAAIVSIGPKVVKYFTTLDGKLK